MSNDTEEEQFGVSPSNTEKLCWLVLLLNVLMVQLSCCFHVLGKVFDKYDGYRNRFPKLSTANDTSDPY